MTYQAPDGWQFPVHGTHHAAPFGQPTPMRLHTRRALRLVATAGTWAAGLCLVIGSVALVAEAAGPTSATRGTAAAGVAGVHRAGTQATAGHGAAAAPVTRTFTGTGNRTTGQFIVAPGSRWELRWSYSCPARAPGGHLIIREGGAGNTGVSVLAAGAAGAGRSWTYSPGTAHYLVVLASCTWTIRVTGRR
jgi:hypothetical protein